MNAEHVPGDGAADRDVDGLWPELVDLGDLTARPNVFHLGRRSYDSLPDYCRGFQAAILPFRTNELTRSVNPVKLREYAAAGLRVEGAAAAPLAVAIRESLPRPTVLIVTGRNIDDALYERILTGGA